VAQLRRDEGPAGAPRARVEDARDHFLADAGRSGDQDPAAGRRHLGDLLAQLGRRRGGADEVDVAAGTQAQLLILAAQPCRLDGALDDEQQADPT